MNIFGIILTLILISLFGYYNLPITKNQYRILLFVSIILVFILVEWKLRQLKLENFNTGIGINSKILTIPDSEIIYPEIIPQEEDEATIITEVFNNFKFRLARPFTSVQSEKNMLIANNVFEQNSEKIERITLQSLTKIPERIKRTVEIGVGKSTSSVKNLSLIGTFWKSREEANRLKDYIEVSSTPLNKQAAHWTDKFDVQITDNGTNLRVKRVDKASYWGQPLVLLITEFNKEESYNWDKIEKNQLYRSKLNPKDDRYDSACIYFKKLSFWAGGYNYNSMQSKLSDIITIYDESWGVWYNKKFISNEKKTGVSCISNAHLLVFAGGFKGTMDIDNYSDKVEIYNSKFHYTKDNAWNIEILPSGGRCNIQLATIKNNILFYGGYGKHGVCEYVDIYDINEKNYPWKKIKLPSILSTIHLRILSNSKKNILIPSKNYINDIPIDHGLCLLMNEKKIYNLENNIYNHFNEVNSRETYTDITGTSVFFNDWVTNLYDRFLELNNFEMNYSVSIWFKLSEISNNTKWFLKSNNSSFPNLIIEKNIIFPIISIEGKKYKQTSGIEINHGWNNLTIAINKNKSYIYSDFDSRLEFTINPEINLSSVSKGFQISDIGERVDIHSSTTWVKGIISNIKFYKKYLNLVQVHNHYMNEIERYNNNLDTEDDENSSLNFYNYYNDLETEELVYVNDGSSIQTLDTKNILSTKYLFNIITASNDKFGVIYASELITTPLRINFKNYIFIYDFDNNIWNIRLDNNKNIFLIESLIIDKSIIISGMKSNYVTRNFPTPILYVNKLPGQYKKPVFKDLFKETKVVCKPGFKKTLDGCVLCPENTYSNKNNSELCTPCPIRFNTNGRQGATSCQQDPKFFELERDFEISDATNKVLRGYKKNYMVQKKELDTKQKMINFMDDGLMTQINNLKKNNIE
jgi:hypothetical protein